MNLTDNKNAILNIMEISKIIEMIERSDTKMTSDEYDLINELKEKKKKMVTHKVYLQLYTNHNQAKYEFENFMQQVKCTPMGLKNYKFYPYSKEYKFTSENGQYIETRKFVTIESHFDGLNIDGFEICTGLIEKPELQEKVNNAILVLTDLARRPKK